MKRIVPIILLICLIGCTSTSEDNKSITVDQIINKYLDAIGGYEKVKNIKSLSKRGHYIEPAYNLCITASVQKKRPNFRKIRAGDIVEEGFNGTTWEYYFDDEKLVISEGKAKKTSLIANEFDYPFIEAEEKGHHLSYKGTTIINGVKAHDIEVIIKVLGSDYIANYYFDTNSFLLIGQKKIMPIHAKGEDVDILVYYSSYREVGGVLMPFSYTEINVKTGAFLNANIWSEYEVNEDIPLSTFDPPTFIK